LLDRRVRTDFDDYDEEDLVALQPFTVLRCVDKKASGFVHQGDADKMVQSMIMVWRRRREPLLQRIRGLHGDTLLLQGSLKARFYVPRPALSFHML
jgi:hypothetical protein